MRYYEDVDPTNPNTRLCASRTPHAGHDFESWHCPGIAEANIHKATPALDDEHHCAVCQQRIKRVPGGQGPTYVHVDTGAVVGHGSLPKNEGTS